MERRNAATAFLGGGLAALGAGLAALAAALAACLVAGGCGFANPLANSNQTIPPKADADLIFVSNAYSTTPGALHELYAVRSDGGGLTRLTFCNVDRRACENLQAAPAPDRRRFAVRRISNDADGDGLLTAADGQALLIVDLVQGAEGTLIPQSKGVTGVDWSLQGDVIVYSATGEGGLEDLYRVDPVLGATGTAQNNRNLTSTRDIRERHPRIDPTGSVAAYERIDATGKSQIWIFHTLLDQVQVTSGGDGSGLLPGTPYAVGSDADPVYSPSGGAIAFRRLTSTGGGALGTWDILVVALDGSSPRSLASGPVYRGAPDWGPKGIVFTEADPTAGTAAFIIVQPDGSGRRVALSVSSSVELLNPRWLP